MVYNGGKEGGGKRMSNLGNKEVMAKNLQYFMQKSGKTQKEIAEVIGVSTSTFNDWAKAKKYPRIDKIEALANYFKILKSDLIEEKTEEHREMQKKNDILTDIVLRLRKDDVFLEAVVSLQKMDSDKLLSLLTFLK
jgi:transcriptional regulator with XRE-family HTH domain